MSEDIKKMEEESVDLAGICGGGVGIVLARMTRTPRSSMPIVRSGSSSIKIISETL